jgi:hypothetical protein
VYHFHLARAASYQNDQQQEVDEIQPHTFSSSSLKRKTRGNPVVVGRREEEEKYIFSRKENHRLYI